MTEEEKGWLEKLKGPLAIFAYLLMTVFYSIKLDQETGIVGIFNIFILTLIDKFFNKPLTMLDFMLMFLFYHVGRSVDNINLKTEPEPEPTPEPEPEPEPIYVGSLNSDIYHHPFCDGAKAIFPENEIWFKSKEDARRQGYAPCEYCEP